MKVTTAIKRLLLILIGLTAVFIAAALFAVVSIDPNDYKRQIQDAAEQATGRKLHLEGDIKFTLFPTLSFDLERVALDNPPGFEGRFASVERVRAELDLLPLLQKRLEIGKITLHRPQLTLYTLRDGRTNWKNLKAKSATESSDRSSDTSPDTASDTAGFDPGATLAGLTLAGVALEDATVTWRDARAGEHILATAVTLETGALAAGTPVELSLDGTVSDKRRQLSADLSLDADVLPDPANQRLSTQALEARVTLRGNDAKPLDIRVNTDAAVNLAEDTADFKKLTVTVGSARVESAVSVTGLRSDQPGVNAKLKSNEFDLRAFADTLGLTLPHTADGEALRKFSVTGDVTVVGGDQSRAVIHSSDVRLDGSRINAHGSLAWLPTLRITLDVETDRVDAGRYLPPAEAGKNAAPKKIPITDLRTQLRMENDRIEVAVPAASLFGGQFNGELVMDADTAGGGKAQPRWRSSGKADKVKLERLFAALEIADKKQLKGRGALSYQLTATGNDEKALTRSLAGSVKLKLEQASFKNPKLARTIERVIAFFEKRTAAKTGKELLFNEVNASFSLARGVADNRDLKADMPLLGLRGAGRVDLVRSRIDYRLHVGLREEKPDENPDERIGIPIKISGALDNPKYSVDLEKALREQGQQRLKRKLKKEKKQLREKLDKKKERVKEKLDELLKDKLKLPF